MGACRGVVYPSKVEKTKLVKDPSYQTLLNQMHKNLEP